ncbi:unnamed protein product, partial [Prorocentrum cordatum]
DTGIVQNGCELAAHLEEGEVACVECLTWLLENAPVLSWSGLVAAQEAGQLRDLCQQGETPAQEQPTRTPPRTLNLGDSVDCGFELYVKCAALTAKDVEREFGRTAKALHIKPVEIPSRPTSFTVYLVKACPESRCKYPTFKLYHRSSTVASVGFLKRDAQELFENQSTVLFGATTAGQGGEINLDLAPGARSSIATWAEVRDRADKIAEKNAKRTRAGSKIGEQDDDDGGGDDIEVIDFEDAASSSVHPFDPDAAAECTGAASSRADSIDHQPGSAVKRQPSMSPRDMGGKPLKSSRTAAAPTDSYEPERQNPHTLGTVDYWVWELAFERAFNGHKNGRAENQARQLVQKLTGTERRTLQTHLELYNKAKLFDEKAVAKVPDGELMASWEVLRKAGATLTQRAVKALARRTAMNAWQDINKADLDTDKMKQLLVGFMERCRPWGFTAKPRDVANPCAVCLVDGCTSDADVANTFLEIAVADTLAEWLTAGPSAADNVKLYCEAADLVLASLPEDAELGDHSASVYLEMTSAIRVLTAMQATSLTADTDMQVYVGAGRLEAEGRRTTGQQSVHQLVGQALLTSANDFWAKKLKWMAEHADAVTKNGGHVKSAIAELERMDANPSEQRAKLLKRIVDDVPYWEAAMYTGCADECKAMVLNSSILQCKALTSDGEGNGDIGTEGGAQTTAVTIAYKELFKDLSNVFAADEQVERCSRALQSKIAAMDLGVKHEMLADALATWNDGDKELTHRLKDALHSCRMKALPEKLQESCNSLFTSIIVDLFKDGADWTTKEGFLFEVLELLAPNVPCSSVDASTGVAAWLGAAWRVARVQTTLAQAEHHVEEGLQDATPADVERHARELTRAVQKANHNARSTALEKFHVGASLQVADAVNSASDLVQRVGAKIVGALCEKTRLDFTNLKKSAEEAAGVAEFKKECDSCTTLNAALDLYRLGLHEAPVNEWLDQTCTIEGALTTVAGKATEYSLPSYSTEATAGITEEIVVIRALCMSAELLKAFGTESLQGNKIAMRNSCMNTQSKLRKFGIQPESLPRVVVSRYRDALKMR